MKVVAYLSSIPTKNKNPNKPDTLKKFITGVCKSGDQGILHAGTNLIDCEVAFIQGWQHEHGKTAPHLQLRTDVKDFQQTQKHRLLINDSNLFNYVGERPIHYGRFSFDGVFPTTGCYFWDDPDPSRWQQISDNQGIRLKDWRKNGKHILICTQRNGGWSMKGFDVVSWLNQTVKQLKKYTDRPIVVRPHPGDKNAKTYLNFKSLNWTLSQKASILDDFNNAWAVITYNSTPGVAASIEGIPAFITDPVPETSQAFGIANTSLSAIESPIMPDRQAWVERLAMCHWNYDELESGAAWNHFKKYV